MRYFDRCFVLCVSVCLLVSPAKADEPIRRRLVPVWIRLGPWNRVVDGGPDLPLGMGNFFGGAHPVVSMGSMRREVDMLNFIR